MVLQNIKNKKNKNYKASRFNNQLKSGNKSRDFNARSTHEPLPICSKEIFQKFYNHLSKGT